MSYCPHGHNSIGIMFGGECNCNFREAIPSEHREEVGAFIRENVPTGPGVFLLHFEKPIGNSGKGKAPAQHFLGWAADCRSECLAMLDGKDRETRFSHIVNVANAKGIKWWPSRVWSASSTEEVLAVYDEMKGNGAFGRKCPECR